MPYPSDVDQVCEDVRSYLESLETFETFESFDNFETLETRVAAAFFVEPFARFAPGAFGLIFFAICAHLLVVYTRIIAPKGRIGLCARSHDRA